MARTEAQTDQGAADTAPEAAAGAEAQASPEGDDVTAAADATANPGTDTAAAPLRQTWTDDHHLEVEIRTDAAGKGSTTVGVFEGDIERVTTRSGSAFTQDQGHGVTRVRVAGAGPDTIYTVTINMKTTKGFR